MAEPVNAPHYERIPTFPDSNRSGELVHAVIETPRNIRHKYAFDEKYGLFRQRQLLPEGLTWPYDYGFIPQTLAADGDPLDVLYLTSVPTFTGCLVQCRVLGIVRLREDGVKNDRVLTAPERRPDIGQQTDAYDDAEDIPKQTIDGIVRFLIEYPDAAGHKMEFDGVKSKKKALTAIEDAVDAYRRQRSH